MSRVDVSIEDVAVATAKGDAVAFVGAGLSAGAGAPTWAELASHLKQSLDPPTEVTDPLLIAQFYRNQHGDHKLFSYLRSALAQKKLRPTPVHTILSSLPLNAFFTTNYDNLLEEALMAAGRSVHVISDDNELALWDERAETQVVKIHGDLNRASTIVVSEQDYMRFTSQNEGIQRLVLHAFTYRTVLFLGFSMQDPDISLIYNKVVHELGELKRPAFILTLEDDQHVLHEWMRLGISPIRIPIKSSQSKTQALANLLSLLSEQVDSLLSPGTCDILIIDDDPALVDLVGALLTAAMPELRIRITTDSAEALILVGKLRPRLVLTGIVMPKPDGLRVIDVIRRDHDLGTTKVIVCTGNESEEVRLRAEELHVDGFIMKPFDLDEMLAKVAECLR